MIRIPIETITKIRFFLVLGGTKVIMKKDASMCLNSVTKFYVLNEKKGLVEENKLWNMIPDIKTWQHVVKRKYWEVIYREFTDINSS